MIGAKRREPLVMLRPASGVLEIMLPEYHSAAVYEVCLGTHPTASDICHWLGHVVEKRWASPEVLGHLVLAIDQVFGLRGRR